MLGAQARALGANGAGVKVGVISDSIDRAGSGVNGSKTLGDLPATVTVLADGPVGSTDEGRAMAEIVYDTAPGIAGIWFQTDGASALMKKAAIEALVGAGVRVIADDSVFFDQPFFQDGLIAQATDAAVAAGVTYVVSAGNRGRQSYESSFRASANGFHDFDPGASVDQVQGLTTVFPGETLRLFLQWDDPWGSASHDFDVVLVNLADLSQLTVGETDNIQSGLPAENIAWQNLFASPVSVGVAIQRFAGTGASFLKTIVDFPPLQGGPLGQWDTASDAINPEAASAKGSIAVGAMAWNAAGPPFLVEDFSSSGPVTHLFDKDGVRLASPEVRVKPEVTGPDQVATSSTFSGNLPFAQGVFGGTSAATPAVAGAAALLLSANPSLTPADVKQLLTATATDISTPGSPDTFSGYGLVNAQTAVAAALPTPSPTPIPTPTPTPVPTVPGELIFANSFEGAAGLTAWSKSVTDGGDLSVSKKARMVGKRGALLLVNDTNPLYVEDDSPAAETRYRVRFYLNPKTLTNADGKAIRLLSARGDGSPGRPIELQLRVLAGAYSIRARVRRDSGAYAKTPWIAIENRATPIEFDWKRASGAGLSDGTFEIWTDGVSRKTLSGIADGQQAIGSVQWGLLAGLAPGASGRIFLDHFESRRVTYIGP